MLSAYQTTLGNHDKPLNERRHQLLKLDSTIKQAVSALKETIPLSLLASYAGELNAGLTINKRPIATESIKRLMQRHGASLKAALTSLKADDSVAQSFPAQAGVSSTFSYMGRFFSIAALTASVELIMPLILWVYTFLQLYWGKYQAQPPKKTQEQAQKPRRRSRRRNANLTQKRSVKDETSTYADGHGIQDQF